MTTSEFLSAHAARDDTAGFDRATGIAFFGQNGLDVSAVPEKMRTGNFYRRGVPELPRHYRRILHGDTLTIGGHDWRVICVFGHAPEHAALHCASLGLLISGDQVLPRITTNVGVWGNQPEANPLRLYLDSFGRFADIPGSVRVLPSHDRVFEGLHARIIQLGAHHAEPGEAGRPREARPARDVLPVLFGASSTTPDGVRHGEAIAHLHYLGGAVRRIEEAACGDTPLARGLHRPLEPKASPGTCVRQARMFSVVAVHQWSSGTGLSHAARGQACSRRSSQMRPGSSFQCSTLPPGCSSS
jgi:glyoxylase-like metal-dependent hydrolase (beta-lactamase superfamily II)